MNKEAAELFTIKSLSPSSTLPLNRPGGRAAGQKNALGLGLPSTYLHPPTPPSRVPELKARTSSRGPGLCVINELSCC